MLKEFKGYKHGVDLGGWLSQCNHTTERYETFIKEEDIKTIAGWGLDHVRVPVDYDLVEDKSGNYKESGFSYIQRAIDWCEKYGLNMILDLHKTYGFSFDDGEAEAGFFENKKYQERFYRLWEEFSKRFAKYEKLLAFELLNEVTDQSYGPVWNDISTECIKRIRAIAPTIKILVGGYWNNSAAAVKDLAVPYDENIVYNFHCYDPMVFTHQGAGWVKEMPLDFRQSIKATYRELKNTIHEKFPMWEGGFIVPEDPDEFLGSDHFIRCFAEAAEVAAKRNVPLYCGEYGVIDRANPEDAVLWFEAISKAFDYYGIGRAAWSFREMDFGIIDARMDAVRDKLVKLL